MASNAANAKAILDALADSLGKTLTVARASTIVEEFTNMVGGPETNEEKAAAFNAKLIEIVRKVGRSHVRSAAEQAAQAAIDDAENNAASSDLTP